MAKVVTFLGTRSEIIKLSPLVQRLAQSCQHVIVHSGQHFLPDMGAVFFEELRLPRPDYNLQVGSDSPTRQIANMMTGLEAVLSQERPDGLVVLGGTSTALAGALAGVKLGIRVAHVEAGVRTFNWRAPEEINRVLIDRMSSWLFAPDERARDHLLSEGLDLSRLHVVGSTTIDACRRYLHLAESRAIVARLKLNPREYLVLTLHRAENTEPHVLGDILQAITALSRIWPIVFPIHPRTLHALGDQEPFGPEVIVIDPLGYLDMLKLVGSARALLTDSSGLQEEAAVMNTPALILRNETEWPSLVETGSSALVGNTYQSLMDRAWPLIASKPALEAMRARAVAPTGGAAMRIARILESEWNTAAIDTKL
ncbi:MAG TPA: UDP-N-acetylglucosamine 2-epimerase (non-hydrolyzing) [Anaerolineae bacterium]|nr:UDP-N-acetylglucosamine 2-epimerase (non-hydrolyzing) [Anaerolineae bacterium]